LNLNTIFYYDHYIVEAIVEIPSRPYDSHVLFFWCSCIFFSRF